MTYDPTQHLGAAFIDDVRPALTTNKSGSGTHRWTENAGGGDTLADLTINRGRIGRIPQRCRDGNGPESRTPLVRQPGRTAKGS